MEPYVAAIAYTHTHAHTSFGYWVRYSDSAFIQIEQALDQKLDDKARSN